MEQLSFFDPEMQAIVDKPKTVVVSEVDRWPGSNRIDIRTSDGKEVAIILDPLDKRGSIRVIHGKDEWFDVDVQHWGE